MTIISIDFSILYPGICICKDFKYFDWIAIINAKISKKDRKKIEDSLYHYPNLMVDYTSTVRATQPEYHLTERNKLINYLELIDLIVEKVLSKLDKEEKVIIALEGISFGSSGNSLVDISQATGILKKAIIGSILNGDFDRFFIFSPSELKNAIGCKGNANKLDIFNKFKEDPGIESVKESDLHKFVNNESWILDKNRVLSPFVDMIDSYLGVKKIYDLLK